MGLLSELLLTIFNGALFIIMAKWTNTKDSLCVSLLRQCLWIKEPHRQWLFSSSLERLDNLLIFILSDMKGRSSYRKARFRNLSRTRLSRRDRLIFIVADDNGLALGSGVLLELASPLGWRGRLIVLALWFTLSNARLYRCSLRSWSWSRSLVCWC